MSWKNIPFRTKYIFNGDKNNIVWFPGHMRTGLRKMRHSLKTTDCVIEVHDARIPLSGRNLDFRNDITGNRPHILVLNKKDLIFGTRNSKESNYKEEKLKERIKEVDESISEVIFSNCTKTRCPGLQSVLPTAIELISNNDRYHRKFAPESNVLVIGIPNVGKSTMINQIRNSSLHLKGKPLRVGNTPGITRHMETKMRVSDNPLVYLIDTPGISLPNIKNLEMGMKLAACGTIRDEGIGSIKIADFILYMLNKHSVFDYVEYMELEHPYDDTMEMLCDYAKKKNWYRKLSKRYTGSTDIDVPRADDAAANFVAAFRKGYLGHFILDTNLFGPESLQQKM